MDKETNQLYHWGSILRCCKTEADFAEKLRCDIIQNLEIGRKYNVNSFILKEKFENWHNLFIKCLTLLAKSNYYPDLSITIQGEQFKIYSFKSEPIKDLWKKKRK